jgi:GntR family transcriptional repressor for pyruvate dehydrogenase complex
MQHSLKPIRAKLISDQVFEQLRELIFRGTLAPGQQLMPERELAEELNVSRTTVRDAISRLVAIGLLVQKQGQGTFVRSPAKRSRTPLAAMLSEALESQEATMEDLLEVRLGLECYSAFLAAQRADDKDVDFLQNSIEEMGEEIKSGRLGTQADVSFHMGIAYATHNPIIIHVMRNFYDLIFYGIQQSLEKLYEGVDHLRHIQQQHTQIYKSIRGHAPERAQASMREHITYVRDFLMEHV